MDHPLTGQHPSASLRQQARVLRRRMTTAERLLWQSLRAHRLGNAHFRRQQILGGFIVDFYCHAARLAVEVDGPVHRLQQERDRERDEFLHASGIRVVRLTNDQVLTDLPSVLTLIDAEVSSTIAPLRSLGEKKEENSS